MAKSGTVEKAELAFFAGRKYSLLLFKLLKGHAKVLWQRNDEIHVFY